MPSIGLVIPEIAVEMLRKQKHILRCKTTIVAVY